MSTTDVTILVILISILVMLVGATTCVLKDLNESICFGISTFICIIICLIMFEIWPECDRIEYDYQAHLKTKPECLKENPETISCINKYKDWLVDSIDLKHKLDSTRAYSLYKLEKAKGK